MRSLQEEEFVTPRDTPSNKGKEIKGSTLLGRPGPASLLIAMVLRRAGDDVVAADLKPLILGHWERGLALLQRQTGGGSVVDLVAKDLAALRRAQDQELPAESTHAREGGYGNTEREKIAAALGREFRLLPIEVRRLLAMVGRFDKARARVAARNLIDEVEAADGTKRVSESQALRVVTGWGLNRLGMSAADRVLLIGLLADDRDMRELDPTERHAFDFLACLGLAKTSTTNDVLRATASQYARDLGEESWA
jgi:hypothetical protein